MASLLKCPAVRVSCFRSGHCEADDGFVFALLPRWKDSVMYRFAFLRLAAVIAFSSCAAAASAQEPSLGPVAAIQFQAAAPAPPPVTPSLDTANFHAVKIAPRRPAILLPMYVSFASLQVLDAHSTLRALDRGAVEANPFMRSVAGSPAGVLAVKAAATTSIVYSAERIWRHNRTAAVVFMAAANSAMALVVQHNYRAVR
jgi:hypothetical protein